MRDSQSLHIEVFNDNRRGLGRTVVANQSSYQILNAEYRKFDPRSGRLRSYTWKHTYIVLTYSQSVKYWVKITTFWWLLHVQVLYVSNQKNVREARPPFVGFMSEKGEHYTSLIKSCKLEIQFCILSIMQINTEFPFNWAELQMT